MRVKINNQVKNYANDRVDIDSIMEEINQMAAEAGQVFTHLKVDGIEIREDFVGYLEENIDRINLIEVELISPEQLIIESLASAGDYLRRALPEISLLTDEFYQGAATETWERFAQLLEGLLWLNQLIMAIEQSGAQPSAWSEIKDTYQEMEKGIKDLDVAVENSDQVLIADLLNYEIMPSLEEIRSGIERILAIKGEKDDLN